MPTRPPAPSLKNIIYTTPACQPVTQKNTLHSISEHLTSCLRVNKNKAFPLDTWTYALPVHLSNIGFEAILGFVLGRIRPKMTPESMSNKLIFVNRFCHMLVALGVPKERLLVHVWCQESIVHEKDGRAMFYDWRMISNEFQGRQGTEHANVEKH